MITAICLSILFFALYLSWTGYPGPEPVEVRVNDTCLVCNAPSALALCDACLEETCQECGRTVPRERALCDGCEDWYSEDNDG